MTLQVGDAEHRLHHLLREAGVDPAAPTLIETWEVFRGFVREPIDTESDGVLVQGGVYRFAGPDRYYFDFVRQVQDRGDDEYQQLHCEFLYEPTAELRALGHLTEWWFADEGTDLDAFLDEIRQGPEFSAVAELVPVDAAVYQEGT